MGKEKLVKFLNKKLKDAKEKLEEISKEIAFINAAVRAIKEKETVEPNLIDGIEKDFSYHLCPDQYVGKIRHKDNWQKFYKRTDIFKDQTSETKITITEDKILLLILESPHTDEFDKNGEPIGRFAYICNIFAVSLTSLLTPYSRRFGISNVRPSVARSVVSNNVRASSNSTLSSL